MITDTLLNYQGSNKNKSVIKYFIGYKYHHLLNVSGQLNWFFVLYFSLVGISRVVLVVLDFNVQNYFFEQSIIMDRVA